MADMHGPDVAHAAPSVEQFLVEAKAGSVQHLPPVPGAQPFASDEPLAPVEPTDREQAGGKALEWTAPADLATSYSISGTLTNSDGLPLSGIEVSWAFPSSYGNPTWSTPVLSDADGKYTMTVTAGGLRYVRFVDPSGTYMAGYYASGYSCFGAGSINVNGDVVGIDAVIPFERHISGTVTGPANETLANITVMADLTTGGRLQTTTSADGTYSLSMPPGVYNLTFDDPTSNYMWGYYSTSGYTQVSADRSPVEVSSVDVTGIDIQLPSFPHLRGTVTDVDGHGLANILVYIHKAGDVAVYDSGYAASDGSYSLPVVAGSYQLEFRHLPADYKPGWLGPSGYLPTNAGALTIAVGSANVENLDIALPEYPHIKGTVRNESGIGIAGISVSSCRIQIIGVYLCYNAVNTASDGTYSMKVSADTWYIKFMDGTASQYINGWYTSTGFDRNQGTAVVIGDTGSVTGIDVTMPSYRHLTGHVTSRHGDPLAGVQVWDHATDGLGFVGSRDRAFTTGADGSYSLPVDTGMYVLEFVAPSGLASGWYSNSGDSGWVITSAQASVLSVSAFDLTQLDIVLPPMLHISGRVTDRTGTGLLNAHVYVEGDAVASAYTDATGAYSISLAPGTYLLAAGWSGMGCDLCGWYSDTGFVWHQEDATPLILSTDDAQAIDIALPGILHITGTVTDTNDLPLNHVQVDLFKNGVLYNTVWSNTDGSFSSVVADGVYMVRFSDTPYHATGWYGQSGFTLDSSEARRITVDLTDAVVNISLPAAHLVSGKVADSKGAAISNVLVEIWVGNVYYGYTSTDSVGGFRLAVPGGPCQLFFHDYNGVYAGGWMLGGGVTSDWSLATSLNVTSDLSGLIVTLARARHISGRVTAAGGGVGNVFVVSYLSGNSVEWTWTRSDGSYSLATSPGNYIMWFEDSNDTYGRGWRAGTSLTADPNAASTVTVANADISGLNVGLVAARRISGWVNAPYVQDVEVEVFTDNGFYVGEYANSGGFTLKVLPGTYKVGFYEDSQIYARGWYGNGPGNYSPLWVGAISVSAVSADVTLPDITLPKTSVPWKPADVGGIPFNQSVLIWWDAPEFDGGLSVTSYVVTADPGGASCSTTGDRFCFVTGLTNGQPYTFSVRAGNIKGMGPASDPSAELTPIAVPDAPGGVSVVGLDSSARVAWNAAADNGSPITGYTATAQPGGETCTTSGDLTCTIGGLTDHTTYSITVTATNENGTGPASDPPVDVMPKIGDSYFPLTPSRILDSKNGLGFTGPLPVATGTSFQVTGSAGVPANAVAVTGVLSVQGATYKGWVALTPEPDNNPTTSTINFPAADARSTGVTVPLGTDGKLSVTYGAPVGNTVHVIFEVTGYFILGTSGSSYVVLPPTRILDSRPTGSGHTNVGLSGVFATGTARTFHVTGALPAPLSKTVVPAEAIAVTGTLTVTGQTAPGFLTIGPDALDVPDTASLFFPKGDNRATGLTVKLGAGGTLSVTFTSLPTAVGATTHAIFDVNGYFVPGTSGAMYVPVTPTRIADSRPTGSGHTNIGLHAKVRNHVAATFAVTGLMPAPVSATVVPVGAVAMTGTLTVTAQTYAGWLSLTPTANNNPTTSTLNFPKGDNRATGVTVPLSGTGTCSVTYGAVSGATTDVIFDVSGYFLN